MRRLMVPTAGEGRRHVSLAFLSALIDWSSPMASTASQRCSGAGRQAYRSERAVMRVGKTSATPLGCCILWRGIRRKRKHQLFIFSLKTAMQSINHQRPPGVRKPSEQTRPLVIAMETEDRVDRRNADAGVAGALRGSKEWASVLGRSVGLAPSSNSI